VESFLRGDRQPPEYRGPDTLLQGHLCGRWDDDGTGGRRGLRAAERGDPEPETDYGFRGSRGGGGEGERAGVCDEVAGAEEKEALCGYGVRFGH